MSTFSRDHNRTVWVDVPILELDRAMAFYRAVLGIEVFEERFGDVRFAVLAHEQGNGGCLVPGIGGPQREGGLMVYFNVHGRIRDAVAHVAPHGGEVLQDVHPIGPHGFRALVVDSEGNRIALHSEIDA